MDDWLIMAVKGTTITGNTVQDFNHKWIIEAAIIQFSKMFPQ